jgi:hypothetical protein
MYFVDYIMVDGYMEQISFFQSDEGTYVVYISQPRSIKHRLMFEGNFDQARQYLFNQVRKYA